ncbi:hypothetical protein pipiens_012058 [Culex pipiens pipiens]|uniref:Uncharacterized protein n=1 Tax=Culex pipiens pipiens TaxID=38569 RepID=A0ABD1D3V7_CULPP
MIRERGYRYSARDCDEESVCFLLTIRSNKPPPGVPKVNHGGQSPAAGCGSVSPFQRRTNDGGGTSVASGSSANRFKSGAEEDGVRKGRHRRSNREVTPCECDAGGGVKKQDEEERQDWPPVSRWRHRSGGIDVKLVLAITVLIGVIDYSEGNFLSRILFSMKSLS